jgi:hypothetical protein
MSRWLPGEHEAVSCLGKIKYESASQAGKAKEKMRQKERRGNGKTRSEVAVYRCDYCRHWHLGRNQRKAVSLPKKLKTARAVFIR